MYHYQWNLKTPLLLMLRVNSKLKSLHIIQEEEKRTFSTNIKLHFSIIHNFLEQTTRFSRMEVSF